MIRQKIYSSIIIVSFIIIIILLLIYLKYNSNIEIEYVKSAVNGKEYMVRNLPDKNEAANMLGEINNRILILQKYLLSNLDKYPKYKNYFKIMCDKINTVELSENTKKGNYTSYTINKGQEIVLCLRSKKDNNIHDINLIMYVVIHELAHVACPEINHTPLFTKIFIILLKISIELKIYKKINFKYDPKEYCGMTIHENLLG